jgi:di/tricarboxylate transporter
VIFVLAVLAIAVLLFVTEWVRADLVALLVLVTLVVGGALSPEQALAGFSNPAVVTVWAVFILGAGLTRTGVANLVGRQMLRVAGSNEAALVAVIMASAAALSAFLSNIGVTALLLPVVMGMARRTGSAPSRLLIPLAYASLLGGLITLIGTPPNLLVSAALTDAGLAPFRLFDLAPLGLAVTGAGILYMVLIGRRLLPQHDFRRQGPTPDLDKVYDLSDQLFVVQLPDSSPLAGKTLAESRLGSALGLNVVAILRNGRRRLAPDPQRTLEAGDRLLVEGRTEALDELQQSGTLATAETEVFIQQLATAEVEVADATLTAGCELVGETLRQLDFRRRFGLRVLAVRHGDQLERRRLASRELAAGDVLLVQGAPEELDRLRRMPGIQVSEGRRTEMATLTDNLIAIQVPPDSPLAGKTLAESRLGRAFGLAVFGIVRDGSTRMMPGPDERIVSGDSLLVEGRRQDLAALQGLQELEVDPDASEVGRIESSEVGLVEAVLAPRSKHSGKTLNELRFRDRFGLNVLAVYREGRTLRTELRDLPLRFGDALLLHGPHSKIELLRGDSNFLLLAEETIPPQRNSKAPLAAAIMAGMLVPVLFGWLPIHIAAIAGAAAMVLTGCLDMDRAYRSIEWRAVFLIAGMLPLGTALQTSGATAAISARLVHMADGAGGQYGLIAAVFLLTALAAQVIPTAAVAILAAPIALAVAGSLGLSPHALLMAVAMASSASFMSPVAHPSNTLIMGPGGYRFLDYVKVGLPLVLVTMLVVVLLLPLLWPLGGL